MYIKITNRTSGPVSLPGPLPRLAKSETLVSDISPAEYDIIKEELAQLVVNRTIDLITEICGSVNTHFTLDDAGGRILFKGASIAPAPAGYDEKVKASAADTTPEYLDTKLVAGTGITLTVVDGGGGNEYIRADVTGAAPTAHKTTHELGGFDKINVGGLNGLLADPQTPTAHKTTHAPDATDGLGTAAAGAIQIGDTVAIGGANTFARSDHRHSLAAPTAPTDVTKATANTGSSTSPARADHKHDITTAAPANGIGGGNTEGSATTLARSDHNHKLREASGPTELTIGSISDGETLVRSGTQIVGSAAPPVGLHAATHLPDSLTDALATAVAGTLSIGSTAAIGSVNSFARSDHVHGITAPAAPADVTKATANTGSSTTPARADHKHDVSTAAPTTGIGGNNSEGSLTTLARSDHNHKLRETGGPTDLTTAVIPDLQGLKRSGTTITGDGTKNYGNLAADPSSPSPAEGDRYYNTVLHAEMSYDSSRSKWLTVESNTICFGRSGNTAAGSYFNGAGGVTFSTTSGYPATYNGTVIAMAITRSDTDAMVFVVEAGGASIATLASSAIKNSSTSLNGDFTQNAVLGVLNQAGGNPVSNVQGWFRVKWRV